MISIQNANFDPQFRFLNVNCVTLSVNGNPGEYGSKQYHTNSDNFLSVKLDHLSGFNLILLYLNEFHTELRGNQVKLFKIQSHSDSVSSTFSFNQVCDVQTRLNYKKIYAHSKTLLLCMFETCEETFVRC